MSKYKTFKEYYADPEYKKSHLEYVKHKIKCDCGKLVARSNMSKHKKTKKCSKICKDINDNKVKNIDYVLYNRILSKLLEPEFFEQVSNLL
jgi:hypothetical protein